MFEVICEAAFGYKVAEWKGHKKSKVASAQEGEKEEKSRHSKGHVNTSKNGDNPLRASDVKYKSLYEKFIKNFDYVKEEQVSIARQIKNFSHTSNLLPTRANKR